MTESSAPSKEQVKSMIKHLENNVAPAAAAETEAPAATSDGRLVIDRIISRLRSEQAQAPTENESAAETVEATPEEMVEAVMAAPEMQEQVEAAAQASGDAGADRAAMWQKMRAEVNQVIAEAKAKNQSGSATENPTVAPISANMREIQHLTIAHRVALEKLRKQQT